MKICSKCKQQKPIEKFYNSSQTKDGKTCSCKDCMTLYRKSRANHYRLYMKTRREIDNETLKATKIKSWRNLDPRIRMFQQSKNRAKRKKLEFNITIEDIVIPEVCPYLHLPFITGTRDFYEQTPSLDRIDNSKGYIKGNIQVITKKANSMKNSASKEELIKFALKILIDNDIVRPNGKLLEL